MGRCCRAEHICGLTEFIEDVVGGGGGGGTPGSPVNSVQYNSAGAFAGSSAFTWNGSTLGLSGSGSSILINRSATALTTSTPALNIAQTWDAVGTTFTGVLVNVTDTTSAAASKIADFQISGASRLNVNKTGLTTISGPAIAGQGEILSLTTSYGTASVRVGTGGQLVVGGDVSAVGALSVVSDTSQLKFGVSGDAGLVRNGAAASLKVTDGSTGLGSLSALALTLSNPTALTGSSAPALSVSQTWNNAATTFTGALINVTDTASAAASKLLDLQLGGSSKANVRKDGVVFAGIPATYGISYGNTSGSSGIGFYSSGTRMALFADGSDSLLVGNNTINIVNGKTLGFESGNSGSPDLVLTRDAADRLALRRTTNAQRFSVYRTWTSSSNFERGVMSWYDSSTNDGVAGTVLRIGTEKGTLGGLARDVALVVDGTTRMLLAASDGSLTKTHAGTYSGPATSAPIRIQADGAGNCFILANSSTDYTRFVSGGVAKGLYGTGSTPLNIIADGGVINIGSTPGPVGITNGSTGPGVLAIDNVQGTNFERLKMEWASNVARIGTSKGGSGTARDLAFITDNTVRLTIYGGGGINCGSDGLTAYSLNQIHHTFRIQGTNSPASGAAGNAGEICWDSGFLYICTASGAWKRVALTGGY